MFYWFKFYCRRLILIGCLGLSVFSLAPKLSVLAQEQLSLATEIKLSPQQQSKLNNGEIVLLGEEGEYIGRVVAKGDLNTAWEILTDYDNFERVFPNIDSSKLLESNGNRYIFEQINVVDLWLFKEKFTVKIAATENYPQSIDFNIVEGDLKTLRGTWQIEPHSSDRILVTHRVKVQPNSNSERSFFFGVYESSLEDTLKAIAKEIERRSSLKSRLM